MSPKGSFRLPQVHLQRSPHISEIALRKRSWTICLTPWMRRDLENQISSEENISTRQLCTYECYITTQQQWTYERRVVSDDPTLWRIFTGLSEIRLLAHDQFSFSRRKVLFLFHPSCCLCDPTVTSHTTLVVKCLTHKVTKVILPYADAGSDAQQATCAGFEVTYHAICCRVRKPRALGVNQCNRKGKFLM